MKITKRQLKRIIREACGDAAITPEPLSVEPAPAGIYPDEQDLGIGEPASAPCPFSTADQLTNSGMSQEEIMQWIETLATEALASEPVGYVEEPLASPLPAPTLELVP